MTTSNLRRIYVEFRRIYVESMSNPSLRRICVESTSNLSRIEAWKNPEACFGGHKKRLR